MPHLVLLYTRNLESCTDVSSLCRRLCDAMGGVREASGKPVFPVGGTRVLAYPAAHSAVADSQRDYMFLYLNLRMAQGRSAAVQQAVGRALADAAHEHLDELFRSRLLGMTLQIDEGCEVFDHKHSTIHPLFAGR
jgi:5-carboxymethyl-2-hydroxymuconate isomerase